VCRELRARDRSPGHIYENHLNVLLKAELPVSMPAGAHPEGLILCKTLGIVHVFIACQPTVDRLPQQIRQGQLGVFSPPTIL
jgi:hypothetical protein